MTLRITDDRAPHPTGRSKPCLDCVRSTAKRPQRFTVPVGRDIEPAGHLPHGGRNVLQFSVAEVEGELTDRNNTALVRSTACATGCACCWFRASRTRATRTWRNLLKSDSSVDLVHFTILRPPEKQDGVPVRELSLIAFPTRELFLEKIEDFDLIIFDRYKRRGILPSIYLDNVREYVEQRRRGSGRRRPRFRQPPIASTAHPWARRILPARTDRA